MKQYYSLIALFFAGFIMIAQDGSLDTAFGNNGIAVANFDEVPWEYERVSAIMELEGGNILAKGTVFGESMLFQYTSDGSFVSSYGNNGLLLLEDLNFDFRSLYHQQENGLLIVGGYVYNEGLKLYRISVEGEQDTTFGDEGVLIPFIDGGSVGGVKFAPDGSFFVSGQFDSDGNTAITIKKFSEDGILDLSFGGGEVSIPLSNDPIVLSTPNLSSDGTLFVSGTMESNGGRTHIVAKFLSAGAVAVNFGSDGLVTLPFNQLEGFCRSLIINLDGAIFTNCISPNDPNSTIDFRYNTEIHKILPDGLADTTFGNQGTLTIPFQTGNIRLQPNQRILFIGSESVGFEGGSYIKMRRYFGSGHLDNSFNFEQYGSELSGIYDILHSDGTIKVAAGTPFYQNPNITVLLSYNNSPLGIEENLLTNTQVYPNPSTGIFNIKTESLAEATPFTITDLSGKLIKTGKLESTETTIDLSNTANGLYFLNAGGTSVKLVKE